MIRIVRAWILSQNEKTGVIKRTPVRIQITLYYPPPLSLSEDALFLDQDDYQSKLDALLDEPNIQVVDVKLYTLKKIFLKYKNKNVKIVGYKNDKLVFTDVCILETTSPVAEGVPVCKKCARSFSPLS